VRGDRAGVRLRGASYAVFFLPTADWSVSRMKNPAYLAALCLCLGAALPAAAAADPVEVAPLADSGAGAVGAAGRNSGCLSKNIIAFNGEDPGPFAARHKGDIACEAPLARSECVARLFTITEGTATKVNEEQDAGQKSCAYDSTFFGAFPKEQEFSERYTFKLTLKRGFVWGKPSGDFCERRNERRQLVCSGSHQTFAPTREVDRHES
jgi:hypothetical protein